MLYTFLRSVEVIHMVNYRDKWVTHVLVCGFLQWYIHEHCEPEASTFIYLIIQTYYGQTQ